MNKILELIDKALDTMQLPGFEHTQETCDAFTEVANALAERRQLEQAPITEDWLKEHGWRQCGQYGHQFVHPKCFFWLFGLYGFTCWEIIKTEYTAVGEKSCVFCEITTVAQLLDALELCNIKID